jgi:hypothetical protein
MTTQDNAHNRRSADQQEGFTMSYRCGSYYTTATFDDRDCSSVVANMASFLAGCGFSPSNVIDCMAETAENLEAAWRDRPVTIDDELMKKWNLYESEENA